MKRGLTLSSNFESHRNVYSQFNEDKMSEEMEEQLCFLWDMTFEKDVVNVLLKHDFTSLAYQVIQTSPEPRLVVDTNTASKTMKVT